MKIRTLKRGTAAAIACGSHEIEIAPIAFRSGKRITHIYFPAATVIEMGSGYVRLTLPDEEKTKNGPGE